ncbi:MAG: hypothetical protein COB78_01795 [Hyphomicrobiales bacterium]|nr:MAG: hypothetical protein COB78_01795 [Hyphomicrobiales bacterium]
MRPLDVQPARGKTPNIAIVKNLFLARIFHARKVFLFIAPTVSIAKSDYSNKNREWLMIGKYYNAFAFLRIAQAF